MKMVHFRRHRRHQENFLWSFSDVSDAVASWALRFSFFFSFRLLVELAKEQAFGFLGVDHLDVE
jgi:hypothetical protein